MRAITIGLKDILIIARDRKTLFTIILTPLILTLILGTALGSMWGDGSAGTLGTLLVVNNDGDGDISKILVDEVYGSEEFSTRFTVKHIEDSQEGENMVQRGEAFALVIIPKNFSENALLGKKTTIEIIGDAGNQFLPPVIFDITEIFKDEVSARLVALEVSQNYVLEQGMDPKLIEALMKELETPFTLIELVKDSSFANRAEGVNSNPVTAIGYYSVAMGVMYLLFNANLGGKRILLEREQGTLQRLKVCKASTLEFILGKTLGIYFSALLQIIVLIVATSVIYGVNWGPTLDVFVYAIIVVFAASGIGIFIASLSTTSSAADGLGSLIILAMSALGGSMWPLYGMPPIMRLLSNLTFNRWAVDGFVQIMFGNTRFLTLNPHLITLLGIGLVTLIIATFRLAKMEVN